MQKNRQSSEDAPGHHESLVNDAVDAKEYDQVLTSEQPGEQRDWLIDNNYLVGAIDLTASLGSQIRKEKQINESFH